MVSIAICDDDFTVCTSLENMLADICKSSMTKYKIDVFYSGRGLLERLLDNSYYDVLFLDIEMCNINGVEVGKFIRDKMNNDIMHIVYISGRDSYAMELFDTRPLNFLIKPLTKDKINKAFKIALKLIQKGSENFIYHIANTSYKRPIKDILYFESDNRKINIVTNFNTESFYGKMDNVYEQVKDFSFLYIHKSYLINYDHVVSIAYDHLIMSNGVELGISQKRRKKIREMQLQIERNEIGNGI